MTAKHNLDRKLTSHERLYRSYRTCWVLHFDTLVYKLNKLITNSRCAGSMAHLESHMASF